MPHTATENARVEASLDNWKRKLLDLSRRNRLLNFKPTKVSTVAVVDELPVEVFRQLHGARVAMRFRPLPDPPAAAPDDGAPLEDAWDVDDPAELRLALPDEAEEPGEEGRPARRHTDEWLQTNLVAARLDHSLRRIAEQAHLTLEEQGVNTLFLSLGMLHFYEAEDSDTPRRAPLLLLPVQLERASARARFALRATDDDPLLNPALAEYLRRDFGLALPELPESLDDLDAAGLFDAVRAAVAAHPRWRVGDEIVLGLLSFQKFVMYKDLERNREAFAAHRLVHQLATRSGAHTGLPPEVRALDLDREHPPETTYQVVDADGSQLRAAAAVARGHDLVLEGPPGTGKSQTITNLIAGALAAGRTVLFVSEKMAALEVVYGRLKGAGLGEFCLEMHSQKANRRAVLAEMARSLDASLTRPAPAASSAPRLQAVRAELTGYATALHGAETPLDVSPYQAYGRLAALRDAPVVRLRRAVDDLTPEQLETAVRALHDLAAAAAGVGDPAAHPWRDSTRTFYPADARDEVRALLEALGPALREAILHAAEVEHELGVPPVHTLADVHRAATIARVLQRSPGAPAAVLASDAWNSPPPLALELLATGRRAAQRKAAAQQRFAPAALEADHAADATVVERLHAKWYRMLSGDYRRVRAKWLALRLPGYTGPLAEQAAHLREVDALRADLRALREHDAAAASLFGALWQGEQSRWDELERYVGWVVEFRSLCVEHGLGAEAARAAARPQPDVSRVETLRQRAEEIAGLARRLEAAVGWPDGYLAMMPLEEAAARMAAMDEGFQALAPWTAYARAAAAVLDGPAAEMLALGVERRVEFPALAAAFERGVYQKWLDRVVERRPALERFHGLTHEQRVAEFRELDRRVLQENRDALVGELRDRTQQRLRETDVAADMVFLRGQLSRLRGHAPLRRTLKEAHRAIKAIKPCFMMSPLTVAQFLDAGEHHFDLVVFDEASQMPAEDAVGAVVRGDQLVVVGDPKQLPPTNFFAVQSGQVEAPLGEDGQPLLDDMESILEEFMAAGLPKSRLRWHYRSQHESLIAFSNVSFYDAELLTFPSADTDTRSRGLQFVHVEDGLYEGAGLNRAEARRVADAVVEHIRTTPHLSLGVGTFNLRQQLAIQDELELRRRQDPSLEPFFAPRDEGGFFVKNLENIQGDDRDVILLSVTYAKGPDGVLRHNFGPINGENGWRRLNVLTTRARLRMRVFSSMRGDEIDPTRTQAAGAMFLRDFLLFAERGQLASVTVDAAARTESPFEREVFQELVRRGVRAVPQVGVAGYRVDLGVLDDEVEGRFVCGIECDGAAYHSAETARDRDRLRQQVLEGLGWTIHRLWSTDWFKDPQGQVERLVGLIEASRQAARAQSHAAPVGADAPGDGAGEAAPADEPPPADEPTDGPDERPEAEPYRAAQLRPRGTAGGVLGAKDAALMQAVWEVAEAEGPVHVDDIAARIAAAWGEGRVGSRIAARIEQAVAAAVRRDAVRLRGEFVWRADGALAVRSRAGQGIPAERIAPEEYREAVLQVLRARGVLPRKELTAAVRAMLGFARTGARLEEAIGGAVESLLQSGELGEGSAGLGVRG